MKKLLLSLVLSMLACVGYAELGASPYEWICDKNYSVTQKTDISVSLGNVSWTQIWTGDNGFYGSRDGNKPISLVFGSNTKPIKSLIFSTDAFAGKEIISITINAKKHTNANTTFAAKIDDIAVGDNKSIGNSFSDIQFSNINKTVSATGKLELIFENSSTATSKNGGVYIHSITIKYTEGGETPNPGLKDATLAFSDASLGLTVGESKDGLELTTKDTDGDITIESLNPEIATYDATTGKVTGVAVGTATIKATSAKTETYAEGTATYTVNVSANIPESSIDNPLTVAKALEICAYAPKSVYVKGIVTKVTTVYSEQFSNVTYNIADEANGTELEVYRGKWGADVTAPTDKNPEVGATVIVKGDLQVYNSKKQFAKDSQIVSYTAPENPGPVLLPAGLEFSAAEHTVKVGETVDGLALTKPENNTGVVTYTSSNDAIATVNAETGAVTGVAAGTVTITATSTETDTYKAGKASYTLTVVDPNAPTSASVDLTFKCGQSTGNQIGIKNITKITYMIHPESQSLVTSLSGASNLCGGVNESVRFGSYDSGEYKQGTLTITLKEAYKITSIDVTITTYKSKKSTKNPTWNLDINGHQMVETLTSDVKTATTYNIPFETVALADESAAKTLTIKSTDAPVDVYSLKINYEPTSTGVNDIIADDANAPVEYYNLQGVRVANPESGLYIRVQGKKATKVLVK